MADPRRDPLPPPFPVGTRVRYTGKRRTHTAKGKPILHDAIVVEIVRVIPGVRGTGGQFEDADGPMVYEDTGEPILDETKDGYSVYEYADDAGQTQGRLIRREDAGEWEIVP